jgi:hypothetical protein
MAIDQTSCTLVTPSTTLLICIGLVGVILGLGLALVVMGICTQLQRSEQRKRSLEEKASEVRHKQEQEAALAQREREQEAIDRVMDEHIDCSECWQERHPGMHFPLSGLRLCGDHSHQHMLAKAASAEVSQQHVVNHKSLVNNSIAVEEMCA